MDAASSYADNQTAHTDENRIPVHLAQCWGCQTRVQVPVGTDGSAVPEFKCGYCGALTTATSDSPAPNYSPARRTRQRQLRVFAVVALIAAVVVIGCSFVLPQFPAIWLHGLITAWLAFLVLFNYVAAVTKDPGIIRASVNSCQPVTEAGAMEGYTHCKLCDTAKPPDAHHCRTCGACIDQMDHHCVFIGNCVGSGNRRWFIALLYWAIMACIYVVAMTTLLMQRRWDIVVSSWHAMAIEFRISRAFMLMYWLAKSSPAWLLATMYLLVVAVSLMVGMCMLLQQQMLSILTGISYVDALKMQHGAGSASYGTKPFRERLRAIFGDDPPWQWLLPRWKLPASLRRGCKKGC